MFLQGYKLCIKLPPPPYTFKILSPTALQKGPRKFLVFKPKKMYL